MLTNSKAYRLARNVGKIMRSSIISAFWSEGKDPGLQIFWSWKRWLRGSLELKEFAQQWGLPRLHMFRLSVSQVRPVGWSHLRSGQWSPNENLGDLET